MPAVVVDSSVLITLAAGEQFHLLREYYSIIRIPLVDGAQGRKAAAALGLAYTGTLGVPLRAKAEGKVAALRPVLVLLSTQTTFWLSPAVESAALKQAGEG